jgi:F-type H+-transporting ATPase subunit a
VSIVRFSLGSVGQKLFTLLKVSGPAATVSWSGAILGGLALLLAGPLQAAVTPREEAEHAQAASAEPGGKPEGISARPEDLWRLGALTITNSMVVTWTVAVGLIAFAQRATRRLRAVPAGLQNFWEWLIDSLYGFLEDIIGHHLVRKTFWFFASIFIFILFANWISLIPGVGTIGWGIESGGHFRVEQPLLRGANADLSMTLAMAMVFFACWLFWALGEIGLVGFLKELFAPKGDTTGLLRLLMIVVFFAVGCLEIISILFRPISLSFRLYGNIFAGENMLEAMSRLVPGWGWLLPVPFYFLELLVGLVQALVFMLLTTVFTLLICQHEEAEAGAKHE